MARLHWLTLGAAAVLSVATALPALADGPVRPGLQIPEPQIPGQVLPRQPDPGPCPGAAEIVNQYGTCTPCLPNSIAGRTNTVCVCSRDFVEISRDAWGRATCVAAADVPTPGPDRTVVSVNVPAGEFYGYARQLGFDFRVVRAAGGPLTLCGVNQEGDAIYAEYSPVNITLAPPQIIDDEKGITLASDSLVADDLRSGRLIRPFALALDTDVQMFLVFRSDRAQEPAITAFRDWIVQEAATALPPRVAVPAKSA